MKTGTLKTEARRRIFQIIAALGFNLDFLSLLKGNISQVKTKGLCVPALNCYSCPAAVGACPVGALQNSLNTLRYNLGAGQKKLGLYVIGSLGLMGIIGGRLPCGWLCPFGLLQELVYKVPVPKVKLPAFLTNLRYLVLAVMVLLLPLLVVDTSGLGLPWFCKWVCPAGTLEAGIVLSILNPAIRAQLGFLFAWKLSLLILFLVWMAVSMRPFCRTVCPLGTILGFFNRVSAFRMNVDLDRCIVCNACQKVCPVNIRIYEDPDSSQCIRCLKCEPVCPTSCISHGFSLTEKKEDEPVKIQP
ncbi:MAG: 4Fe-4S binding protein [Candidatus Saccharicenans sp.]|jgi:NAD-dependent dihydropyrimidine dehydrogenase PreA subunit|nr:4Fe-4S binding protein [Candidatus Saccharicenans sp.]MDH7575756.1 4Fe-4S binding protein [Candidatus Saccharicenans sp.]